MDNKKFQKRVLITGITSGIGSEIAYRFAEAKWHIVGHYVSSSEKAESIQKKILSMDVSCKPLRADLSVEKEVTELIQQLEIFEIDTLINNAGTYFVSKHFSELTFSEITSTFMVNTFSPILIVANLFDKMKARGFGRIVNISSIAAKYGGSSFSLHYGSSKRALEGLTKTLAKEGAEHNVLVNTLRPGVIDTDFHKKFPKDMTKRIEMIPVKKMGTGHDIAEIVYFLGSELNQFVTNDIITAAGGE